MPFQTTPKTARDVELAAMPSIMAQFPIKFAIGSEMTNFEATCTGCQTVIPDDQVTGQVSRPYPNVAIVEAVGICVPCKLFTRYHYRLHDDMRFSGIKDGKWVVWQMRPTFSGWLRKIRRFLFW